MSEERWLPVPDFPGYEASDLGRLRSHLPYQGSTEPRIRKLIYGRRHGYYILTIYGPDGRRTRTVHRLVLEAFVGPRPAGMVARHLNGDKTDNRLANLTYGTPSQNNLDTVAHGSNWQVEKTHCANGHEFTLENTDWRPRKLVDGTPSVSRVCRACVAIREANRPPRSRRKAAA